MQAVGVALPLPLPQQANFPAMLTLTIYPLLWHLRHATTQRPFTHAVMCYSNICGFHRALSWFFFFPVSFLVCFIPYQRAVQFLIHEMRWDLMKIYMGLIRTFYHIFLCLKHIRLSIYLSVSMLSKTVIQLESLLPIFGCNMSPKLKLNLRPNLWAWTD